MSVLGDVPARSHEKVVSFDVPSCTEVPYDGIYSVQG